VFINSRIQKGIADYIPSLNQGLAVLTNSTVLRSLRGLVSVKKDSPSEGVSDSCRVLSSTVLAVVPP
jgi:hypothetical protein